MIYLCVFFDFVFCKIDLILLFPSPRQYFHELFPHKKNAKNQGFFGKFSTRKTQCGIRRHYESNKVLSKKQL